MSEPHVISFFPDGTIEHTRSAALDKIFGTDGVMQRVTDIGRCPDGYYINWLMGPNAGHVHTYGMSMSRGVITHTYQPLEATMFFDTYENAVAHEVSVLNAMRIDGVRFHDEKRQ